jgi:restriction system protein
VIHAFRTVVADSGANLGYIVSSGGFQSGAFTTAELSNVRLVTWEEFQKEFTESWFEHYLLPFVAHRLAPLLTYTEPLLPRPFFDLTEAEKAHFLALKDKYDGFDWLMMTFTPYSRMFTKERLPKLSLRERLKEETTTEEHIPAAVLDAVGYRDFLDAAVAYGDVAIAEFRKALKKELV